MTPLCRSLSDREEAVLTLREREVLDCARRGLTVHETARILRMAAGTAKTHRASILRKLGAANITEAVGRVPQA